MSILDVTDVWYKYPGAENYALKGAYLTARRGVVTAILGPNGCGKTTLLMIASGLIEPERGMVLYRGRHLKKQLPKARRHIGFLFQNPDDQLFNPSVYEELRFTLQQLNLDENAIEYRIREILRELYINEALLNRPPYRLSFGEKRLVTLASILVYDPEVILLDEPTSNLSAKAIDVIEGVVMKLKKLGKAVVIASHNVEFIARVADEVYVMNEGRTIIKGETKHILIDTNLMESIEAKPPLPYRVWSSLNISCGCKPLKVEDLIEALQAIIKRTPDYH